MVRRLKLDYTPADQEQVEIEPLKVDIRDQEFTCVTALPAIVALELGIAQDPDGDEYERLRALKSFMLSLFITTDRERFRRLLVDASPVIEFDELMHYVNVIGEELSDRPTVGQSDSPSSLPDTETFSTAESSGTPVVKDDSSI